MTASPTDRVVPSAQRRTIRPSITLALAALGLATAKVGLGLFPEWRRFADATMHWPDFSASPLLTEADATLVSNSAGSWLLAAVGFRGPVPYLAGSLLLAAIAIVLPFLMPVSVQHRARPALPRLLFIVVAGGAIAPVLLTWIGSYDALVVIAATIAALSRNRWASAAGWLLMGLSHATVAALAFVLWAPMAFATHQSESPARRVQRLAMAALGTAVGWLLMRAVADAWGGSTDRWQLLQRLNPSDVVHAYFSGLPLVLFGILGVTWLVVLRRDVLAGIPSRILVVEAAAAALLIPLIAVDETRIGVLCLLASTLAWAAWLSGDEQRSSWVIDQRWRAYALAAAIIPVMVVWQGAVLYPGWDVVRTLQSAGLVP